MPDVDTTVDAARLEARATQKTRALFAIFFLIGQTVAVFELGWPGEGELAGGFVGAHQNVGDAFPFRAGEPGGYDGVGLIEDGIEY